MNCRVCGTELPPGALFCGECGSSVTAARVHAPEVADPRPSDTTIVEPLPSPARPGPLMAGMEKGATMLDTPAIASEQDSESPVAAPPASFTLTFSSGGTEAVTGSGLLGRRPIAQPGESFDLLVAFVDPGRSVSKTHLEFGIEGDEFWICDRYSANGTVIRVPGGTSRLCEPGRRYRVSRGTRVEIGEQYFDVN